MKIYYSVSRNGFFDDASRRQYEESQNGWPEDAKQISEELYHEMFEGQRQGMEIVPGDEGLPVLKEPVTYAPESDQIRLGKIFEADEVIRPMLGYAVAGILSDLEKEAFKAWNEYRKALENVDVTAADIEWPAKPE